MPQAVLFGHFDEFFQRVEISQMPDTEAGFIINATFQEISARFFDKLDPQIICCFQQSLHVFSVDGDISRICEFYHVTNSTFI